MEQLITLFQNRAPDAEIVLIAPTGMEPDRLTPRMKKAGFGAQTNVYLEMLSNTYEDLAETNNYNFLTLFGVLENGMTLDGAHPTAAGHAVIAEHIWNSFLEEYLN